LPLTLLKSSSEFYPLFRKSCTVFSCVNVLKIHTVQFSICSPGFLIPRHITEALNREHHSASSDARIFANRNGTSIRKKTVVTYLKLMSPEFVSKNEENCDKKSENSRGTSWIQTVNTTHSN